MKKFILKCIIAVSIPFLCILPFLIAGFYSKEMYSPDTLIQLHLKSQEDTKFGLAYTDPAPYYKFKNIVIREPKVLALGTSCVLQLKGSFFNEGQFYNGGRGVKNINEFLDYMKAVEEHGKLPEILIIGLDWDFFNDAWNGDLSVSTLDLSTPSLPISAVLKGMIPDFFQKKWSFSTVMANNPSYIGINASLKNNGFLKDGSYYHGFIYEFPEKQDDYEFKNTFWRIEKGTLRFEYGEHIDTEALECLETFLQYCTKKGVYVVGFTPPLAPSVLDKMETMGTNYGYVKEIPESCSILFSQYEFEYYDFLDLRSIGLDDSYFIDGFHASESALAKMLLSMIDSGSIIHHYIPTNYLQELYNNRASNILLHPYSW